MGSKQGIVLQFIDEWINRRWLGTSAKKDFYQIFLLLKSLYLAKLRRDQGGAKSLHWESPKKQKSPKETGSTLVNSNVVIPVWKQQQIQVGSS